MGSMLGIVFAMQGSCATHGAPWGQWVSRTDPSCVRRNPFIGSTVKAESQICHTHTMHTSRKRTLPVFISFLSLFGCGTSKGDLPVVKTVDIQKYCGTWYEIMRLPNSFEKGLKCTTANY